MGDNEITGLSSNVAIKYLLELQKSMDSVLKSLDELNSRVKAIEKQVMQNSEPKQDYLKETREAIRVILDRNGGIPISKTDIATFMGLSESTIYFRCEKLVEAGNIKKFYGRDLGFEPAKSVFYSIPITLYDLKSMEIIEKEPARKIALALVQSQPLSERDLLSAGTLTGTELKEGITYLLNRGLIARKNEPDGTIFYAIPQD